MVLSRFPVVPAIEDLTGGGERGICAQAEVRGGGVDGASEGRSISSGVGRCLCCLDGGGVEAGASIDGYRWGEREAMVGRVSVSCCVDMAVNGLINACVDTSCVGIE
mmetsp:Transcript_9898/g.14964  ORF Transcript_9898/g.14964 Transcript_9898/m.14964 type:complete len:107 (-) Transcript_9898:35-355(-)